MHQPWIARLTAVLALLAGTAFALVDLQPRVRGRELEAGRSREGEGSDARPVAPLFSFAVPAPGYKGYPVYAGLPATDGCKDPSTITGTKGEALTFTRATASSCCTATDCSTLEQCTSGQVCISPYSGGRGIRVNRGYTNDCIRSEELDNAAWSSEGIGVAGPTVTANDGVAPDGTTSAERLEFPATASGEDSIRYQVTACNAATCTFSCFVKGKSGTGTTDICVTTGGAAWTCAAVAFTTTWQRFSVFATVTSGGHGFVGNATRYNGGTTRTASDVHVWGCQANRSNAYAMPYAKTTSAAVTVNAETATFPISAGTPTTFSMAADLAGVADPTTGHASAGAFAAHSGFPVGGPEFLGYWSAAGTFRAYFSPADRASVSATSANPARTYVFCNASQNGVGYGVNTATNANDCGTLGTISVLALGWFAASTQVDAIVGNVCASTDDARCR